MAKIDWKNAPQQDPIDPLTDMDPQSAAAIPGMRSMVGNAINSEQVEDNDAILPDYNSPIEAVGVAIPGIGMGMAKDLGEVAGNEIGAIGRNIKQPTITDSIAKGLSHTERVAADEEAKALMQQYNEEQRAQRAADIGFDKSKTYYHGSQSNIEEFDPSRGKLDRYKGKIAGFFTDNPSFADEFSLAPKTKLGKDSAAKTYPVHLKLKNTFDPTNEKQVDNVLKSLTKAEKEDIANEIGYESQHLKEAIMEGNWQNLENPELIDAIQDVGHDSMHVTENGNKNIAVFNPNQIRSKFAQFDKTKAKSGKISYAEGGKVGIPDTLTDEQMNAMSGQPSKANIQSETLSDDQLNDLQAEHDKNSDFGSQVQTGLEGAARGIAGPLAPMAEQAGNYLLSGQSPEQTNKNIRAREEANPGSAHIGEALGMGAGIWTGTGVAGGISKAAGLIKAGEGAGLGARIGATAIRGAVENAALQSSDEAAKMIEQDPNQSAQTAITHIGLAGLLGGGLGGSFELAHGALNKLGQVAADFKGRLSEHLANPEPVEALHKELSDHYNGLKDITDNVYSGSNIKKQDILKVMPEASTKMADQVAGLTTKVDEQLEKMMKNENRYPAQLTEKLGADVVEYKKAIQAAKSPAEMFEATQDLKQNLYAYAKFEKQTTRLDPAYDFVKDVKGLGHEMRMALEEKSVWGKAAERQAAINSANTEFAPALKDFEKKFTTEISGETVIDPAKVSTFIKQLGKPQAEIKQEMLSNFLKASEKYKKVIAESHANLGLESPLGHTSLHHANAALQRPTLGGKLADIVVHRGLGEAGGKGAGAVAGAMIGHHIGIGGEVGAIVGQHALGPFFSSVLPALAKPLLNAASHATAFQHAADYAASVAKGERLSTKVTENLFKDGKDAMKGVHIPTDKEISKLDKVLENLQISANGLLDIGGQMGHYLPDHVPALAQTAGTAVQYLNSQRPNTSPKNPLDTKLPPAPYQQYEYQELLKLAEQPLIAIGKIQKGTITHKHVQALQMMYPDLYKGLNQKLMNGVITTKSKNQLIPYNTKLGLSVFMGQPLDSSMNWMSIQSTQAPTMGKNAPSQQNGKPPAASSTKELTKAPAANRTPSQARQYNQQTKD